MKQIMFVIISIVIIAGTLFYFSYAYETIAKKKIYSYDIIVINGQEYKVSDISEIDYSGSYYDNKLTITLEDGTTIICSDYTLKNEPS